MELDMGRTFKPDIDEKGTHHGFKITEGPTMNYGDVASLAQIIDTTGSHKHYQALLAEQNHTPDNNPTFKPDMGPKR